MSTAGFHITEDCAEGYLQNESGMEFLQLARWLHDFLRQEQFRLPKLLGKPLGKLVRQVCEIRFAESDDKEISRDDVINITIRIAQRTVERQTIQLSGLAADQRDELFKGIHGLDISADHRLHAL